MSLPGASGLENLTKTMPSPMAKSSSLQITYIKYWEVVLTWFLAKLQLFQGVVPQRQEIFFRRLPPKNVKLSPAACSVCHARGHHHHLVDLHSEDENSKTIWRMEGWNWILYLGKEWLRYPDCFSAFSFRQVGHKACVLAKNELQSARNS